MLGTQAFSCLILLPQAAATSGLSSTLAADRSRSTSEAHGPKPRTSTPPPCPATIETVPATTASDIARILARHTPGSSTPSDDDSGTRTPLRRKDPTSVPGGILPPDHPSLYENPPAQPQPITASAAQSGSRLFTEKRSRQCHHIRARHTPRRNSHARAAPVVHFHRPFREQR